MIRQTRLMKKENIYQEAYLEEQAQVLICLNCSRRSIK
jgi:hypothetical protein